MSCLEKKTKQPWNFPLEKSEPLKLLNHILRAAYKVDKPDLQQQLDCRVTHHWDRRR